jgi:hypothetical protein
VKLLTALLAAASSYVGLATVLCLPPFDCPPDVQVDLASSKFNPPGYDDPASEYVCLVNEDDHAVTLTGWVVRDAERDVNVLPRFTLGSGGAVRVHPGRGTDRSADLFGKEGSPVWNNSGDTVTLLDADGEQIDTRSYGATAEGDGGGCG